MESNGKVCTTCGAWKPFDEFYKRPGRPCGYVSECKVCARARSRKYAAEHSREDRIAHKKQWHQDNREQQNEYCRRYKAGHREEIAEYNRRYYAEHREEISARHRKWIKDNPARCRVYHATREARKNSAGGFYTPEQFISLCKSYDNRCLCCGSEGPLQADHVIPISKGGSSDISNIQPLCPKCNNSKRAKIIDYRLSVSPSTIP